MVNLTQWIKHKLFTDFFLNGKHHPAAFWSTSLQQPPHEALLFAHLTGRTWASNGKGAHEHPSSSPAQGTQSARKETRLWRSLCRLPPPGARPGSGFSRPSPCGGGRSLSPNVSQAPPTPEWDRWMDVSSPYQPAGSARSLRGGDLPGE